MNADVKQLKVLGFRALNIAKNNAVFIFIILGLAIMGYLVFQIRTLAAQEPSDDLLAEKMGETRPIRIDEDAVETVKSLQDTNIEVKALFDQNRNNPFSE